MPRTSALQSPGCPPLRAITTDSLGLVKVIEARQKVVTATGGAVPNVVETWGPADATRGVVAASFNDRKENPILAVARKNGLVECLNPLNGDVLASAKASDSDGDPFVGLHLFKKYEYDSSSRFCTLLTCTQKGKVCLRYLPKENTSEDMNTDNANTWTVCNSGNVQCCSVSADESHALFGGKAIELKLWDLAKHNQTWSAKYPRANSLGIFTPTWFTSATFLCKEDHRKFVAGTANHQIRLYDSSAQRRPVLSFDFRESPITAVTADHDGCAVYVGTSIGDLASFDMRTGKLLGCYAGKCSGSIRSITRHPELHLIASCGLDTYLRIWDAKSRQLLSAVYLKQPLANVHLDSHFSESETDGVGKVTPSAAKLPDHNECTDDGIELNENCRPKKSTRRKNKTKNGNSTDSNVEDMDSDDDGVPHLPKKRKSGVRISRVKASLAE